MYNAEMQCNIAQFKMGEHVEAKYFGICRGRAVYVVHKESDPNISEVIFETFLKMYKEQLVPIKDRRHRS